MHVHSFSDPQLLNLDLAEQIKKILCDAINQREQAYLVVSGGKTPVELFKILARMVLPWDKVTIILADERCVATIDAASNERLVRDYLMQDQAKHAHFISLFEEQLNPVLLIYQAQEKIASLPTFDAVILGMGEDGHTASLFPCSEEIDSALDDNAPPVLLVNPRTAPYQRISLSKKRLLDSHTIFLHVIGQKKRTVLNQAMAERNPLLMPISAFLNNQNVNVQVMYAP
ncbi:MAG: 6-phosphogluconolactonase [Legionella sp.]|nr:6-phosphogluconolactonase [Legionella sp.]